MKVGPSSELNVEEGEHVELTCNADGNPLPTQFDWLHLPTGDRFTGQKWKVPVERRMSGDYRCTALNSIDTGADRLTMDVLYGPVVTVSGQMDPVEGHELELDCNVDANPKAESVVWTGPGGFMQKGSRLIIDSVVR